jgi:hypothetical protein
MIPSAINSDYPKFVPNQVLTSDNLNDLFGYLDEQQRITRTNLLGIGIVCGLQVKTGTDPDGSTYITITEGCGVTSQGYLVTVPEVKYHYYNDFDAVKCQYYDRFVNNDGKTQKFLLWELKQKGDKEDADNPFKPLNSPSGFLSDKVVLIFVELLETNNKNCDPNSCDDKGALVTVNFRPLLVDIANVETLLTGAGAGNEPWLTLPEISMKRFDVKATPIFECLNIFDAYGKILNNAFLADTQSALTSAYNTLNPVLSVDFPSNPFATLAADFKFLNDGSISTDQLIAIQYYYDLFSDILLAYNEFRKKGIEFIGECCPDDDFPRHLLLDLAIPDTTSEASHYRHYFIPSPILQEQHQTISELTVLFKKLVLLIRKFAVPPMTIQGANRRVDNNIRITPSTLGNVSLSEKAIPYYYPIPNVADPLLKNWSPEKSMQNKITRNLSYHAINYNSVNDDIRNPLLYDLEPYNFLRIEGHIGKPYQHVVRTIADIRNQNRLPFDIVALSADVTSITAFIKDLGKLLTSGNTDPQATLQAFTGSSCHFNDLEVLFDSLMTELTGKLSNEMKFFYDLKRDQKRPPLPDPTSNIPQAPLLVKADPSFRFAANSIGHEFELFYPTVKDLPFIPIQVFFQSFGQAGNTDVMDFVFKAVLYYIEMLWDSVTSDLSSFGFFNFNFRYFSLIFTVRFIKAINKINSELFPLSEEENDHLDALLSIVVDTRIAQLYLEFLKRVLQIKIMQQAGYYAICHPGIQHKAGVPMGGTFIVVYHEAEKVEPAVTNVGVVGTATFAASERQSFVAAGAAAEVRFKADATPQDHLNVMAAGINERVFIAKDRVESGLKRSFKVDFTKTATDRVEAAAPAGTAEPAVAATATVTAAAPVSTVYAQSTRTSLENYQLSAAVYLKNRKDNELDEAIGDINDGVVIADFYLPYLCCSDCPPIQMIVMSEPEPQNLPPVARAGDSISILLPDNIVTLDGTSSSDPDGTIQTYKWEQVSGPGPATLQDPNSAVTKASDLVAGEYIFKLTVTDDRGAVDEDTVTVKVSETLNVAPTAVAFTDSPLVIIGEITIARLIGENSIDPDGTIEIYSWTLKSGTATAVSIETPNAPSTNVRFFQVGTFVFTLTVTDNRGATGSMDVTVVVQGAPEKSCGPLSDIVSDFVIWNNTAKKSGPFKEAFASYEQVVTYFKALDGQVVPAPVEDQINFFEAGFFDLSTQELIMKWLNELQNIIQERKDIRLLALRLYRILNQLSMYIVCIQPEDFDKGRVPMIRVFELIRIHVQLWVTLINQGVFSPEEIAVVKGIGDDMGKEIQRVEANGEKTAKAKYVKFIGKIVDMISNLP